MARYLIWFPVNSSNPYNLRITARSVKDALSKLIFSPREMNRKPYLYFEYNGKIYGDTQKYSKQYDPNYSLEHLFNLVWKNKDFDYIILKDKYNSMSMAAKVLNEE